MDCYSSSFSRSIVARDEDPFHFTPAYGSDDIICPGSDTEETPEETAAKRRRYEEQAQRVFRGKLPVLESARLKGPLTKESGWVNPWRYRPRKKDEKDWWQPQNLDDMMFTRENVRRRAAQFGLGHLKDTEALAWCRAEAEAQAEAMLTEGKVVQSVEQDVHSENNNQSFVDEDMEELPVGDIVNEPPDYEETDLQLEPPHRQPSYISTKKTRNVSTPYTNEIEAKGTKRPVDAHWLKVSYVSKRARWDGPSLATPTPLAALLPERERRRLQNSSKPPRPEYARMDVLRRPTNSFPDIQDAKSRPGHKVAGSHNSASKLSALNILRGERTSHSRSRSSEHKNPVLHIQDRTKTPQDDPETEIILEMRSSQPQRQRTSMSLSRQSSSSSEARELDVITPATNHQHKRSATSTGSCRSGCRTSPSSNGLPKPPANTTPQYRTNPGTGYEDEDSFITDVAPSSRNVEEFHFRKKRKAKSVSVDHHPPDHTAIQQKSRPLLELTREYSARHLSGPRDFAMKEHVLSSKASVVRDLPPLNSEPSDNDDEWDTINDITYNSSFIISNGSVTPNRQTYKEPTPQNEISMASSVPEPNQQALKKSPRKSAIPLALSQPQSQALPKLRNSPEKSPKLFSKQLLAYDPNDISTQSYNTTPNMSARTPVISSKKAEVPASTNKIASLAEVNDTQSFVQDEMEIIQFALSQALSEAADSDSEDDSQIDPIGVVKEEGKGQGRIAPEDYDDLSSEDGFQVVPKSVGQANNQRGEMVHKVGKLEEQKSFVKDVEIASQQPVEIPYVMEEDSEHEEPKSCQATPRNNPQDHEKDALVDGPDIVLNMEIPEPGSSPKAPSEASWEGCGPQSPWGLKSDVPIPFPVFIAKDNNHEASASKAVENVVSYQSPARDAKPAQKGSVASPWQQSDHETLLEEVSIKPFKSFQSPTPSPGPKASQVELDGLTSTQVLVDAATINPWNTTRIPSSTKSHKRVSFVALPQEKEIDSQSQNLVNYKRASPPPPQSSENLPDEDPFDDGTTTIRKFAKHFVAASLPRQFRRILPDSISSPLNSSPAFGAQAEAFIAADQEVSSARRAQTASLLKTPSQRPKNRMSDNSVFGDLHNNPWHVNSEATHARSVHDDLAGFDMDEALGDAASFLQDWSVEAEIQKSKNRSKEAESATAHRGSTGFRRRKLFGLV